MQEPPLGGFSYVRLTSCTATLKPPERRGVFRWVWSASVSVGGNVGLFAGSDYIPCCQVTGTGTFNRSGVHSVRRVRNFDRQTTAINVHSLNPDRWRDMGEFSTRLSTCPDQQATVEAS